MLSSQRRRRSAALVGLTLLAAAAPRAADRPIDTSRSTLTVLVYKSGLFSAFADNHIIKAPIASGSLSDSGAPSVEISVKAADLVVTDPGQSQERRGEIQARMLGGEVLDVTAFPTITFASTSVKPSGPDRWTVDGRLTLHGRTQSITFTVVRVEQTYRGDVTIKQRDFGIEPIRVAGGAVKVKDEVKVTFEIVAAGS